MTSTSTTPGPVKTPAGLDLTALLVLTAQLEAAATVARSAPDYLFVFLNDEDCVHIAGRLRIAIDMVGSDRWRHAILREPADEG